MIKQTLYLRQIVKDNKVYSNFRPFQNMQKIMSIYEKKDKLLESITYCNQLKKKKWRKAYIPIIIK